MKSLRYSLLTVAAGLIALGAAQQARAVSVILEGNYLRVGVNDSGGLIDDGFDVGIDYAFNGDSAWTGFDFLKPGTPFEFYSLGYEGIWAAAGYYDGNPVSGTTTNTSAGSTLSTLTTGSFGALDLSQMLSFGQNSGVIDFSVTLTNNSSSTINNVVYARGLDPDQDVFAGGGYDTTNTIVNNNLVTGSAPITDWTIGIYSDSAYAHTPTVRYNWPYGNPYGLLTPVNDGYGDYAINMAWDIGSLGAGESATVAFQYRIAETQAGVVPENSSTLGLLAIALAGLMAVARRQSLLRR